MGKKFRQKPGINFWPFQALKITTTDVKTSSTKMSFQYLRQSMWDQFSMSFTSERSYVSSLHQEHLIKLLNLSGRQFPLNSFKVQLTFFWFQTCSSGSAHWNSNILLCLVGQSTSLQLYLKVFKLSFPLYNLELFPKNDKFYPF